ncbi:MAG: hypothetical protein V7K98_06315 [Nostoc sp.]|uniref:hypothetical protein n=1 Tax=Nostoc sp. TaxID=1180 RepID=UPI002FF980CE
MAGVVTLLASYPYPVVAVARIGSESLVGKLLNWMVYEACTLSYAKGLPNKKIPKKLSSPHSSVLRQVLQRGEPRRELFMGETPKTTLTPQRTGFSIASVVRLFR